MKKRDVSNEQQIRNPIANHRGAAQTGARTTLKPPSRSQDGVAGGLAREAHPRMDEPNDKGARLSVRPRCAIMSYYYLWSR